MDNGSVALKASLSLSLSLARSMCPASGRFLSHIVAPLVQIMKRQTASRRIRRLERKEPMGRGSGRAQLFPNVAMGVFTKVYDHSNSMRKGSTLSEA